MKCVIPGLNVKVFARAIHSLARIGDELYVEPTKIGVSFRTVDSSKSAFGSFFFKVSFFSSFEFKIKENGVDEENFKCKVAMKACLNAFRSASNIEKSVERCKLIIDPVEDRLVVNMTCRHNIQKTYNLSFIECETLEAEFDRSSCPLRITSQSRVLCDAFRNFRSNQEEVTILVSPKKMVIRNYVDDDPDPAKTIHTELTLEADEFDEYEIPENCEITFSLKEVRSLLTFSEPVNQPVSLVFTKPGTPIIFFIDNESLFEANFVLATLNSKITSCSLQSSRQPCESSASSKITTMRRSSEVIDRVVLQRSSEIVNNISSRLEESEITNKTAPKNSTNAKFLSKRTSSLSNHKSSFPALAPDFSLPAPTLSRASRSNDLKSKITYSKSEQLATNEEHVIAGSDEEEVRGTPPAKRRKYYFKRCFQPTFDANNISAFRKILADDSDEDNST